VDGAHQTVIMVQVENAVGVLGDSRDRSAAAEAAFGGAVPAELMRYLKENRAELVSDVRRSWESAGGRESGTWQQIFSAGTQSDELFMAWHYARYCQRVTSAGKEQYALPMYVNAWLNPAGQKPGEYPSGGPLPHVMDLWRAGAPSVDLLAPDIYAAEFAEWCTRYTQRGNALFIPEMRRGDDVARNVFHAIGEHEAIGVSPFAVDSIEDPAHSALARSYGVLEQIAPIIGEHAGAGKMAGFVLDQEHPVQKRMLGGYELEIALDAIFGRQAELGYGIVIATGDDEFLGAGSGFGVKFRAGSDEHVGIAAADEGAFRDGKWIPGRRLNGDENDQGQKWRFPIQGVGIGKCRVYRYGR
jgi:hypothetical protein